MDQDELQVRRVEVIRELCQGPGLTDDHLDELPEAFEVFGGDASSPGVLRSRLTFAAAVMPTDQQTWAIRNALGLWWTNAAPRWRGEGTLTERRESFLADMREADVRNSGATAYAVTYRTLVRHEIEGAEILSKMFDTVAELHPDEALRRRLEINAPDGAMLDPVAKRLEHLELMVALLFREWLSEQSDRGVTPKPEGVLATLIESMHVKGSTSAQARYSKRLDEIARDVDVDRSVYWDQESARRLGIRTDADS